jgi:O-antigen/teichoic acid export membrane protein
MKNNEWKRVYISLVAAVLFIFLIVVASGTMDGMSGGYAVMFVSLCSFRSPLLRLHCSSLPEPG